MNYFLAIIGGGPAGYTAAETAARAGKDVVLFEQHALGGTCLNEGCIPTKTLLYSAKQYYQACNGDKFGVHTEQVTFDYQKMQQRKTKVVRKLTAGIKQRLQAVTVIPATAKVMGHEDSTDTEQGVWRIEAADEQYLAENILICTGSVPFIPPIPGIKDNPFVWDSTAALEAKELPQNIAIIGGGVIGMEFATLYHELGVQVTVIEALPRLLANLDEEISAYIEQTYRKRGIAILTNTRVEAVDGQAVRFSQDGQTNEAQFERILVCVGRRANLSGLEALTDLEYNRGAIVVDDFLRTNLPGVYAAGDVTGKIMLAHVASRQAEVAVGRMLKHIPMQRIAYNAIPSVVYTNPEVASIGISDTELEGTEVVRLPMTYAGRFVAENEGETGLCKIVIDKKKQLILGVHLVGNPASEIIAAASVAVRMGYTLSELRQVVFPHPTVSEVIREATCL